MYLIVPAKLKSFFGVNDTLPIVNDDQTDSWRIDFVLHQNNHYALIVHCATLFCKIVPCGSRSETIIRLADKIGCGPFDIIFGTNNNRSVIGSLKDMRYLVDALGAKNKTFIVSEIEDFINNTPFSYIGMQTPKIRWLQLTNQGTGSGHK